MMGFPGILPAILSTHWLRVVRAFTSAAKLTIAPGSRLVLRPFSVFQLIEDQLFATRERLFLVHGISVFSSGNATYSDRALDNGIEIYVFGN